MAIEKVAYDALDKLVNIKVAADYLGDSATEEETAMLEKEAAIAGTLTKMMTSFGSKAGSLFKQTGKLAKSDFGKSVANAAGKAWSGATNQVGKVAGKFDATKIGQKANNLLKKDSVVRDFWDKNKTNIRNSVIAGAATGGASGAMSGYRDPEDHKVHRMKNILHGATKGAVGGAVGATAWGALKYKPSAAVQRAQNQKNFESQRAALADLGGSERVQGPINVLDEINKQKEAYSAGKLASTYLDELVLEKQANVSGITTIGGTALGAIKGATKAFAKSTGSMPQRLGQAALGGLKSGAKGAMAGATGGAIMDAMTNKTPNDQQTENRFQ